MERWTPVATIVALSSLAAGTAAILPVEERLFPEDVEDEDHFGTAVAVDEDTAIVGARYDDDQGYFAGSAYVFHRTDDGWTQATKLLREPSAADDFDVFGTAVALDEGTAIVGASGDDETGEDSGGAYVYERTDGSWHQQAKLVPGDVDPGDEFGASVAIDGDTAIVGARSDGDEGEGAGSAYIFERSGSSWSEVTELSPDDGGDRFGASVDLEDGTAIVGAPHDDDQAGGSGSVYVFERAPAWRFETKLLPGDGADGFGRDVAFDADTAIVGAPNDDAQGDASGSAYVFARSGASWTEQAKLAPSDLGDYDRFGTAVGVDRDLAVVGAPLHEEAGQDAGSAWVFIADGSRWALEGERLPGHVDVEDEYGSSVAVGVHDAFVAAPDDSADGDPEADYKTGSVYRIAVDQDRDGLKDDEELSLGTDLADPDTDGDRLEDGREALALGTDPLDADTDGDELEDGAETEKGTDPLDPDTDDDGLTDGVEIHDHGTDPFVVDTDEDDLDDGEEVLSHGTDPLDPDTDDDLYGDGTEVECGSDPHDATSIPLPLCALPDEGPAPSGPTPSVPLDTSRWGPSIDERSPPHRSPVEVAVTVAG